MQVTRLRCGGFVFGVRLNHTMSDAAGLVQFMSAVADLARGADVPAVLPVWRRDLLSARDPPRVTCTHHEYDIAPVSGATAPPERMAERGFFFGPADIAALRSTLPPSLRRCSAFEVVAACAWRCRVIALSPDPGEEIRISCLVNCRKRLDPPLPEGYYGNAIVYPAAVTAAGRLCSMPLQYAVELVRNAKAQATEEYVRSVSDLMVMKGQPIFKGEGTFIVSDVTRAGFEEVDFGWGAAAYGGPAECGIDLAPGVLTFVLPYKKREGEKGIVVPMSLPEKAMKRFVDELETAMAAARKSLAIRTSAL